VIPVCGDVVDTTRCTTRHPDGKVFGTKCDVSNADDCAALAKFSQEKLGYFDFHLFLWRQLVIFNLKNDAPEKSIFGSTTPPSTGGDARSWSLAQRYFFTEVVMNS
jgi:hypothetical protein